MAPRARNPCPSSERVSGSRIPWGWPGGGEADRDGRARWWRSRWLCGWRISADGDSGAPQSRLGLRVLGVTGGPAMGGGAASTVVGQWVAGVAKLSRP
jgi:hypothetical protein